MFLNWIVVQWANLLMNRRPRPFTSEIGDRLPAPLRHSPVSINELLMQHCDSAIVLTSSGRSSPKAGDRLKIRNKVRYKSLIFVHSI